jgi:hypothetical protein
MAQSGGSQQRGCWIREMSLVGSSEEDLTPYSNDNDPEAPGWKVERSVRVSVQDPGSLGVVVITVWSQVFLAGTKVFLLSRGDSGRNAVDDNDPEAPGWKVERSVRVSVQDSR